MTNKAINTNNAPSAIGPYSQAVLSGTTLYVSGQLPIDSNGELVGGDIKASTSTALSNLQATLEAAGYSLDDVVKCEVFLADMSQFADMNEVYGSFFTGETKPARQAIEAACLPKNAEVEISCIAVK